MSEFNDLAFLSLVRDYGAQWVILGLVSSEGLKRGNIKSMGLVRCIDRIHPAFAQIFGANPQSMAEAAKMIEDLGFDGLDINAGCPAPKVMQVLSGAALLDDLKNAQAVVKSVRRAVKIPVTIKMRLGRTGKEHLQLGKVAEDLGLNAVILHPRTARQGYGSRADWQKIAELKSKLKIPVIASGDIRGSDSFLEVLRSTGCDGALIGRAALGTPWIFRECLEALSGKVPTPVSIEERKRAAFKYLDYLEWFYGEKSLPFAKNHLFHFVKGLPNASHFRRELQTSDQDNLSKILKKYFDSLRSVR